MFSELNILHWILAAALIIEGYQFLRHIARKK